MIIANKVYNTLGAGHSESVYHRAMEVMFRMENIPYTSEVVWPIMFMDTQVGFYRLDSVITLDEPVILEFKSISKLRDQEEQQIRNYLKVTGYKTGILVNFGPSLELKLIKSSIHEHKSEE